MAKAKGDDDGKSIGRVASDSPIGCQLKPVANTEQVEVEVEVVPFIQRYAALLMLQ